ncbi:hypothetical protein KJ365_08800 [Glaciecola sp. XM2]|uniref:FimV/HubP family polar landmark protein n=1 Tax=Glaciecola sp. XM2 TaxID=1914931 RepID=UPI001BDDF2EC|nr:FimV/HubP family polar landmark protein [Glaciecola sp. XM2]MBT1450978.1 hypothetical protein [Glaciecola sp. XM2]
MLSPALLTAQVQIQGPRNAPEVYSGVVYGPIDQSDTLWRIASRYKQDSQFTIYQTMLAIYELNPQAFENRNFNTMINGATLQLPSDRYIARMDPQRARAKAEADDAAFGRPNSVQENIEDSETGQANNLKPEVPLVNQEDLSATQTQLQNQLNSLNRQQTAQFDQVKEQVSASISNVQALIEENRKVFERLDQVNQDITDLRSKVEGEVQEQIDQQLALQKELIELVKQAEQRQLERERESIWTTLSSPTAIIVLSSVFTAGALLILGIFLLRRPKTVESEPVTKKSNDIVDDELVIGEMDDDFDSDADDLMAALEQEMGEDDILSSELEDGLDELGVDDDFSAADEMLVPDAEVKEEEKPRKKQQLDSVDEDISFDTDSISLDDDDFENQEIDLKANDEPAKEAATSVVEDVTADLDLDNFGEDEEVPAEDIEALEELASVPEVQEPAQPTEAPTAAPEVPDETSQVTDDEVAQQGDVPQGSNKLAASGTAIGVALDESGQVSSESLKELESTINETTEEFEQLSNEILDELENPGDAQQANGDAPADLEAPAPEVTESDEPSIDSGEQPQEPVEPSLDSGEQPQELDEPSLDSGEQPQEPEQTAAPADTVQEASDDEVADDPDALFEQALAGMGSSGDADGAQTDDEPEQEAKQSDELTDELLNELEDEQASEELDSLLDEFANEQETFETDSQEDNVGDAALDDDFSIDLDDAQDDEPEDASNALADELLSELEQGDDAEDDELDALLESYSETSTADNSTADSDALLDDIPSLSDLGEEKQQDADEVVTQTSDEVLPDALSDEKQAKTTDVSADDVSTDVASTDDTSADDLATDDDEDVLADLPGLDDWLEDDELDKDIQNLEKAPSDKNELDMLAEIEGSDFDDLLSEIDADSIETTISEIEKQEDNNQGNAFEEAGLNLDALMSQDDDKEESIESFIDVDDLLSESEGLTPLEDEDLALDLDASLPNNVNTAADFDESDDAANTDQASNLDLAQVYIDMDDFDAAKEVLAEVQSNGTEAQAAEAKQLLQEIADKS